MVGWNRFPELWQSPSSRRMRGYIAMHNPACPDFHDDEAHGTAPSPQPETRTREWIAHGPGRTCECLRLRLRAADVDSDSQLDDLFAIPRRAGGATPGSRVPRATHS